MSRLVKFSLCTVSLAICLTGTVQAQRSDILPPSRRQPSVEQAAALAGEQPPEALPAELNNPFFPNSLKPEPEPVAPVPASSTETAPAPVVAMSSYDLLETIAPQINPSGTLILRGHRLLLFGQKKIQIGDVLPIVYQEKRYELIISNIEASYFTIQLNGAEVTRPIIPAN